SGNRAITIMPMMRRNEAIGLLSVVRRRPGPLPDKQLSLLRTFAAQAVIAIENARLLNELRESLEQQTATADLLKVISSSPGELAPVFQSMLAKAVQICEAKFGVLFRCTTTGSFMRQPGSASHPNTKNLFRNAKLFTRMLMPPGPLIAHQRTRSLSRRSGRKE